MLSCEGYKMFRGWATIVPKNGKSPYKVYGDWLYKPEWECWYCAGSSYPKEIVTDFHDYQEAIILDMMEKVNALEGMEVTVENSEEVKKIVKEIREQMACVM